MALLPMMTLLPTRKQVCVPVAGNLPREPPRQATGEVDQFPIQEVIERHLPLHRRDIERTDDVLRQVYGHGTQGKERREHAYELQSTFGYILLNL
jgi:hypothetical protein